MATYLGKDKVAPIIAKVPKVELVPITEGNNAGSYKLLVKVEEKWQ